MITRKKSINLFDYAKVYYDDRRGEFCHCVEFYYYNVNCSFVNSIIPHFSEN